jgi:hypothetical protein
MPYSHDGTSAGSSIEQYFNAVIPAFEKVGYVVKPGPNLEQWLKEAGFINVCARKFLVPFGMWPKDKRYVCDVTTASGQFMVMSSLLTKTPPVCRKQSEHGTSCSLRQVSSQRPSLR